MATSPTMPTMPMVITRILAMGRHKLRKRWRRKRLTWRFVLAVFVCLGVLSPASCCCAGAVHVYAVVLCCCRCWGCGWLLCTNVLTAAWHSTVCCCRTCCTWNKDRHGKKLPSSQFNLVGDNNLYTELTCDMTNARHQQWYNNIHMIPTSNSVCPTMTCHIQCKF